MLFRVYIDVWSFGVVMWETFSAGKTPYAAMNNVEVLDRINGGYRLPMPEDCPKAIYELMSKCWSKNPNERPSFKTLFTELDTLYEGPRGSVNIEMRNVRPASPNELIYHNA